MSDPLTFIHTYCSIVLTPHLRPSGSSGRWSTSGCRRVRETQTEVMCACDHLSSFAVILVSNPRRPSCSMGTCCMLTYSTGVSHNPAPPPLPPSACMLADSSHCHHKPSCCHHKPSCCHHKPSCCRHLCGSHCGPHSHCNPAPCWRSGDRCIGDRLHVRKGTWSSIVVQGTLLLCSVYDNTCVDVHTAPIIYNTSAYVQHMSLAELEGTVDVLKRDSWFMVASNTSGFGISCVIA